MRALLRHPLPRLLALASLPLLACDPFGFLAPADDNDFLVQHNGPLVNAAGNREAIHIIGQGEGVYSGNVMQPGGSRNVHGKYGERAEVTFHAHRSTGLAATLECGPLEDPETVSWTVSSSELGTLT